MRKRIKTVFLISIFIIFSIIYTAPSYAQCYGSLNLPADYFKYDYLVRLCVHFGDLSDLPGDVICSRTLQEGESLVEVPVYFFNARDGIIGVRFAVESFDSIASFSPQNGFSIIQSSKERDQAGYYRMNIKAEKGDPLCGPALIGYAYIVRSEGSDPVWVNIEENSTYGGIYATDRYGNVHYAFSPRHGGYVGSDFLYTCQEPICEEPNLPVLDLVAEPGYANSVKLTWIAGGGDHTIIRYSTDHFPEGYADGLSLVNIESSPGEIKQVSHVDPPSDIVIYYTAFSVSSVSGEVIRNSFVDCGATDTTFFSKPIATETTSWGALKSKMK